MLRSSELRVAREEGSNLTVSRPNRRLFLAAGIGSLLLPSLACAEDSGNEVRRFIETFPKVVPGIKRITIPVLPEQPTGLVGVLEQIHWVPDLATHHQWEVNDCQRELYESTEFLMDHPAVRMRSMRPEAVFLGEEEKHAGIVMRKVAAHIRQTAGRILERSNPDLQHYLRTKIDGYTAEARWGAAEILHYTRGLQLLAAETREVRNAAEAAKAGDPNYEKLMYEDREDVGVALTTRPVDWITYGSGHNWIDNTQKHNEDHPDDQRALLILTPKTVAINYGYPSTNNGLVYQHDDA